MVTITKTPHIFSPTFPPANVPAVGPFCPDCGGNFLINGTSGVTCGSCGLVVDETPVLDTCAPLGRNGIVPHRELFHAHLSTLIGSPHERGAAPIALHRASRCVTDFRSIVFRQGAAEIKGILATLGVLTPSLLDACHAAFSRLYVTMPLRSPLRNVNILALVAVFHTTQARGVIVRAKDLRALLANNASNTSPSASSKQEALFRAALNTASGVFPRPDLRKLLGACVGALVSQIGLPPEVAATATRTYRDYGVLFATWSKVAVSAAGVVAAAILAHDLRRSFPISRVAEVAGVATSAVSRCVARACAKAGVSLSAHVVKSGRTIATWLRLPPKHPPLTLHEQT